MASALVFIAGVLVVLLVKLWRTFSGRYLSPLRHLKGPSSRSFWLGHFKQYSAEYLGLQHQWVEQYGHNICTRRILMTPELFTTDLRTINYILTHSMDYYKPPGSRKGLARILGQGVLVTEGEKHRQQRHVMNPAFGPAQIRELTEIFLEKANNLCEYWSSQISKDEGDVLRTNVMEGLSKMTLDVIGLAGFNYRFDALNTEGPPNELNMAFNEIFKNPPKIDPLTIMKELVPFPKTFQDTRAKKVEGARVTMQRIGMQLLKERKAEVLRELGEKNSSAIEKNDVHGRDLLTLLIKANMATDIPESQRMTDEEVVAQVPTFLVAGHETTSTATTWCLYALTQSPSIQEKLREELLSVPTNAPTMEDLNALPYLDQVVRETLRLHAPVTVTSRVATHDDVLPVTEPFADRRGKVLKEIHISEGNRIVIPILALQTSKEIWGEDALEFRPNRWDDPPEAVSSIPGVWSHLLTFLGGPHACIGYRFSLVEMKALVFTLVRTFEFELAVPPEDIYQIGTFLQRPGLRSEKEKGGQLPLLIRPYKPA